jgi:hypothetical protein
VTLKFASGTWIPLLSWTVLAALAVQAFAVGGWSAVIRDVPPMVLVGWLIYLVLWMPRVVVKPDGAAVVNLLRTYWLPYEAIDRIDIGATVRIEYLADGRTHRIHCWNVPGYQRPGLTAPTSRRPQAAPANPESWTGGAQRVPDKPASQPPAASQLRDRWLAAPEVPDPRRPPRIRWNWQWLIALALVAYLLAR